MKSCAQKPECVEKIDLAIRSKYGSAVQSGYQTVGWCASRIGQDNDLQTRIADHSRSASLRLRSQNSVFLSADRSAANPLARVSSEVFNVPILTIDFGGNGSQSDLFLSPAEYPEIQDRDHAIISASDTIICPYVRKGGRVAEALRNRLRSDQAGLVHVAVHPTKSCAGAELIAAGAVGWFRSYDRPPDKTIEVDVEKVPAWMLEDHWLTHCTRGTASKLDALDSKSRLRQLLVGSPLKTKPIDSLRSIVRSGRLRASALTSEHSRPVVCFTERSPAEILSMRKFRSHLGRWDYEPYGVSVSREIADAMGAQPVIYGDRDERDRLPDHDRFRFHPKGDTHDWTVEREWRAPTTVDLIQLPRDAVRFFAPDTLEHRQRLAHLTDRFIEWLPTKTAT
ncbi:MAG: hypothetical protein AAF664_02430 [Planctomycetota bacterium]